ncbi:F0F1 ATP synthase subunit delta [Legionella impletisoli]|uniref:ATP synthase subunit delta n=1 Tax=Legionella impletisoli TaxID=343510 RepID=A0A917NBM5_9GAMM|nr:F0F1 ATP synthase subunit delta [Legionella impletisoli]GGI86641.1 ATP synthase subunit delta [Legionella impletisoli]
MADTTTTARPYAKAVFEYALDARALSAWSQILQILAGAVLDRVATDFITNPTSTIEQQTELLVATTEGTQFKEQQQAIQNLVALLAENKRLLLLPDIYAQYEALRAEQEKTLTVKVRAFAPLTEAQQQQLIKSLSQRLQRQITLDVTIDESLLGGAVIHAGDLVIDGSVRGKLNKLRTSLAA